MMLDRWGYEVNTASASSSSCISSINSYYHQVLSYGRKRDVIMEAVDADPNCVLANILAALFCSSHDPSRVPSLVHAATSHLVLSYVFNRAELGSSLNLNQPSSQSRPVRLYNLGTGLGPQKIKDLQFLKSFMYYICIKPK
ncbi:putative tetratricopeptide repeat protein [Helianthus debilis subsp. tardiflorus]